MGSMITECRVKEIRNLVIGFDDLADGFDEEPAFSKPKVFGVRPQDRYVTFEGLCERGEIAGLLDASDPEKWKVVVEKFNWSGSGSGSRFEELENILKMSRGYIRFRVLWEGGDIWEYISEDGVVSKSQVDW